MIRMELESPTPWRRRYRKGDVAVFSLALLIPLWCLAGDGSGVKTALKKLSAAPNFPAAMVSPYTNALEEDLLGTFAEERRQAGLAFSPDGDKQAKQRWLSDRWAEKNQKVAEAVEKSAVTTPSEPGVSPEILQATFKSLVENPVTRVDAITRYDKRGDVGFCFGRALWVHYQLLERGVPARQIAKIFAVGKLRYRGQLWDFHMATMARGRDGKWWAIDSLFETPLPESEWRKRALTFGASQKFPEVRFYITDPRKFQPAYPAYELKVLSLPELKPFFSQLFPPPSR